MGGLQSHLSNINGLAQNPLGYRYGRQHVGATMNSTRRPAAALITTWKRRARWRRQLVEEPRTWLASNGCEADHQRAITVLNHG
jgi:hypothetical protein